MNCKPGQLAIIVNGLDYGQKHIGKIIRTTRLCAYHAGCWEYEGERLFSPYGHHIIAVEDGCLKPIDGDESPEQSIEAMRLLTNIPQKETA